MSDQLLAAMRGTASSNNIAMQTTKVIYPDIVDIRGFSHFLDQVGEHFKTAFVSIYFALCFLTVWKAQTDKTMAMYSSTRWWSK